MSWRGLSKRRRSPISAMIGRGVDQPDAAQRLQGLHHGRERPGGQELGDGGLDPLQPLLRVPGGEQQFLQHQLLGGVVEALLAPASARAVAPQVVLPGNTRPWRSIMDEIACRLRRRSSTAASPGADQVAHRLVRLVGHPHRGQLAGPQQAGELLRVAPVRLDPVAGLARDQRRRDHGAAVAEPGQLPVEPIAGRTGLVAEVQPARAASPAWRQAGARSPGRRRSRRGSAPRPAGRPRRPRRHAAAWPHPRRRTPRYAAPRLVLLR